MKLIHQEKLFFREGSSDKVYEIDLCEAGDDLFVVNFRYGKRGSNLKDGTKTIFPVPYQEAEKTFNALVDEKRKKGYRRSDEVSFDIAVAPVTAPDPMSSRKKKIIKYLKQAVEGEEHETWPLSRIIYRAGQLRINEAAKHIIRLADQGDQMHRYCVAWALGRCGDPAAIPLLKQMHNDASSWIHVRSIAAVSLMMLEDDTERRQLADKLVTQLPEGLRDAISTHSFENIDRVLREYLFQLKTTSNSYLIDLYLISLQYPEVKKALAGALKEVPLRTNYFKPVRSIFKSAELALDSEVFGTIAYRIEKTPENFRKPKYWDKVWMDGEYIKIEEELKKPNSRLSYSNRTRSYLRQRILRTITRLGKANDPLYTEMAAGILLAYDDEKDKTHADYRVQYNYVTDPQTNRGSYQRHTTHYDTESQYIVFNYLLYANSKRYSLPAGGARWECVAPYEPGQPAPNEREEAFPKLWDNSSQTLIRLLLESRSQRVHEFAVKAIAGNTDAAGLITIADIIAFLHKPYNGTVIYAWELAKKKYDPFNPDKELTEALLNAPIAEVRRTAEEWIQSNRDLYFSDSHFVYRIITSPNPDTRSWIRGLLPALNLQDSIQEEIIARVTAHLLSLEESTHNSAYASELGDMLLLAFTEKMKKISLGVVRDLLNHKLAAVQVFAGKIMLHHEKQAEELPNDLVWALLSSADSSVRSAGIKVLAKFSDEKLLGMEDILASFCISREGDVRQAVRPVVEKLAANNKNFAQKLVSTFMPSLLIPESYEGLHTDIAHLLTNELSAHLSEAGKEHVLLLLRSRYDAAQQTGAYILVNHIDPLLLTMRELVELAGNENLAARNYVQAYFNNNVQRIKTEREEALRILDCKWDDSRRFAFEFFRNNFTHEDWTPDLLVSVCDSVREDVQALGRELITRFFDTQHGTDYLIKLSQHPSHQLQMFATNYLEKYAAGDRGRFEKLIPYFITVLSQVNKARVAKERVLSFIRAETGKDETIAKLAAAMFTRLCLTVAKTDKAVYIAALLDIRKTYPGIDVPLSIKDIKTITIQEDHAVQLQV